MKKVVLFIFLFIACQWNPSEGAAPLSDIAPQIKLESFKLPADYDGQIKVEGLLVNVKKRDNKIERLGLALFSPELREGIGVKMADVLETEYLCAALGLKSSVKILEGSVKSFRDIDPDSECFVSVDEKGVWKIEWRTDSGQHLKTTFLIAPETTTLSRGENENEFISLLRQSKLKREPKEAETNKDFSLTEDGVYYLPGLIYQSKDINRNVYFEKENVQKPLWNLSHPVESISNLFIFPGTTDKDISLDLNVLKHEYGEQERFTTSLENFLAICEKEGCLPYWGVENFDGKTLKGALFLYNFRKNYDHVLKVECNPADVFQGEGGIKAQASLFIPTDNVKTLFEPYKKKSENEKIKYKGN